jgi:hypothetical protein
MVTALAAKCPLQEGSQIQGWALAVDGHEAHPTLSLSL